MIVATTIDNNKNRYYGQIPNYRINFEINFEIEGNFIQSIFFKSYLTTYLLRIYMYQWERVRAANKSVFFIVCHAH